MKNYLKTQHNDLGQTTGLDIENLKPIQPVKESIFGQNVQLISIAGTIVDSALAQIWACVSSEPNAACWTYLPYSAPTSAIVLSDALHNLFGFYGSTHFLIEVDGEVQGWIALLNPRLEHGAIEIGNVYFSHKMKNPKLQQKPYFYCYNNVLNTVLDALSGNVMIVMPPLKPQPYVLDFNLKACSVRIGL